jgi:hypothetical protein
LPETGGWYLLPRRQSGDFIEGKSKMSLSNLAERMELPATDNLSDPPRFEIRAAANDEQVIRVARPRLSFTNRKFVVRDQGLRLFRVR